MRFLITKDVDGGEAWLTNENACSRYGIPNLEIAASDINGVFGPADLIGEPPRLVFAAQIVLGWASQPERTNEERYAAAAFLRQWPDGPQIRKEPEGAL